MATELTLVETKGSPLNASEFDQNLKNLRTAADTAQGEIDAHEAAADPHPQYETSTEAAAKITAHEGAADPHPGYAQEANLGSAAVADILGTVSQSGGVPTGAIIERGSNANGEYVKFADGTLICWGGYPASSSPRSITLPAAAIDSGYRIMPAHGYGDGTNFFGVSYSGKTSAGFTLYPMYLQSGGATGNAGEAGDWAIVGRWF
ncbi:hypothetical protein MJO47_09405 [Desulfuromonas sp. KJ2020]|uniref:hypothetical protein n=1 Tax=Desulfuromonas sp. KJ2020 TaxID=2919173 RepID=UPI0020A74AF2|nr:hypothetical protein [Desulfuromonas sp. KJ2020]MCP3177314.1 hypothetical protein [Desulfuromonas sp. KJ2020]